MDGMSDVSKGPVALGSNNHVQENSRHFGQLPSVGRPGGESGCVNPQTNQAAEHHLAGGVVRWSLHGRADETSLTPPGGQTSWSTK